jgi:hypothetical protein
VAPPQALLVTFATLAKVTRPASEAWAKRL